MLIAAGAALLGGPASGCDSTVRPPYGTPPPIDAGAGADAPDAGSGATVQAEGQTGVDDENVDEK
jgi:hypothetical protein